MSDTEYRDRFVRGIFQFLAVLIGITAVLLVGLLIAGNSTSVDESLRAERLFPAADQPPTEVNWDKDLPSPEPPIPAPKAESEPGTEPETETETEIPDNADPGAPPVATTLRVSSTEELDLEAQQRMAEAAWWSLSTSVGSLVLAFLSLVLINENLKEARKVGRDASRSADAAERAVSAALETTAVAKEMSQKQLRAYCVVKSVTISGDRSQFEVVITNSGQSPARYVRMKALISFPSSPTENMKKAEILAPDLPSGAEDAVPVAVDLLTPGFGHIQFVVVLTYRDVFDSWHTEETTFSLLERRFRDATPIELDRAIDPYNLPRVSKG